MFIITGTGRSGTGMLARLFGGHHEFRASYLLEKYCRGNPAPFGRFDDRLAAVLDLHQGIDPSAFVDSSNLYIHLLDAVHALHPDARFIVGVRDGRDFARSAITRGWHLRDSFDCIPPDGSPAYACWPSMTPVERAAWIWTRRNEIALGMLEAIPSDRWMLVRIESLDEPMAERISVFAGCPVRDLGAIRRSVNANFSTAFPSWRDWPPEDADAFASIAGGMMKRLGYAN
ncbi:MAG: hypothetical protein HZA20_13955 [Nitrospirae bacterium]|nr:hypothetical protein [Nitrospirota bacterium]